MYIDKKIARNKSSEENRSRKSEALIFFWALCFGFIGIGIGMLPPLRHKIRQRHFRIGIPFLGLLNIGIIYLLQEKLIEDCNFQFYYDASIVDICIQEIQSFIQSF